MLSERGTTPTSYSPRHLSSRSIHIPYRCLTPRGIDNLLIASRAISCDFEAHGATRVMAPICAYSEAAGIAAALAVPHSGSTRAVHVAKLQTLLAGHGQFVEGESRG